MSTFAIAAAKWVQNDDGNLAPQEYYDSVTLEANSQDFTIGDLVYLSAGTVTEYAADGTLIAGFAQTAATNVTSSNAAIRIMKILGGDVWSMSCTNAGTAAAGSAAYIGEDYGVVQTASGWCVNVAETDHPRVRVVGVDYTPRIDTSGIVRVPAVGDTGVRLLVKFLDSAEDHDADTCGILQFD